MSGQTLSVRALTKSFGGSPVLRGFDLDAAAGRCTAVLGASGSGKTTLLRLIAGFDRADAGTIAIGGTVVSARVRHVPPERRGVGYVPQEGALFPHLDVAANIAFGLPRSRRRGRRIEELLDLLDLNGLGERMPHELSGGQQQRVALARALAPDPALILLDEPFDALDAGLRTAVGVEVSAALRTAGATVLLVTHDQEEALSLADAVAVIREGRIVQTADPRSLYHDPVDPAVAQFVGDAVMLPARLANGHAESALGTLATRSGPELADGPATLMIRPEQISCRPVAEDGSPAAPRGRVLSTTFLGHDAIVRLALDTPDAEEITARVAGHRLPQVGEEVVLSIEGSAIAYP